MLWAASRGSLRSCERIVVVASSRHVVVISPVAAGSHHYRRIGSSLHKPNALIAERSTTFREHRVALASLANLGPLMNPLQHASRLWTSVSRTVSLTSKKGHQAIRSIPPLGEETPQQHWHPSIR